MKKALALVLVSLSIASLLALQSTNIARAQAPVATLPLNQLETNPQSSVIDPTHGIAYFGTSGSIVKVSLSNFTRLGAIDTTHANLVSALIDTSAGFAYFGSVGNCPFRCTPGDVIIRIRLSDFSIDGTLTLSSGMPGPLPSVIDPASGYAYFAPSGSDTIVKVRLSDFTQVATLSLSPGGIVSASIDPTAGFAYFGTGSSPGSIVKVRLSDFTEIGSLTLNPGENDVTSVIDTTSGFLFVGTSNSPGAVVKIRLSDFTRVGRLTLNLGQNNLDSSTIDTAGFGYFVSFNYLSPGIILKIRLQDLTLNASLTLNKDEIDPLTSLVDPHSGFAYVGAERSDTSPGIIVKVKTSDLTRVRAIPLDPGEGFASSSVIDARAGYSYFGAPGVIARVNLSTFTEAGSLILNSSLTGNLFEYMGPGVLDPAGGFAYFAINRGAVVSSTGIATDTGAVLKIRLSNFTIAGLLTLKTNECCFGTAVIDPTAKFAYFGGSVYNPNPSLSNPGQGLVVKIRLSDFTEVKSLSLNQGEVGLTTSVIDTAAGFAYFATGSSPGVVVKVNLSNLSRVGALTLNLGTNGLMSSVIDPIAGFAYFGTSGNAVVKVRLADFSMVGTLTLAVSETGLTTAAVDTGAGFAYFVTYGGLVKVRLSDFTRVDSVVLPSATPGIPSLTSVIDPGKGFLYIATSGVIVKVDLNAPPPPPFDYALSNSGNISIAQGNTGTTTITVTLNGGTSQGVTLHCIGFLPTGVSCSFNPSSLTPTASSTLDVSTSLSTPTGSYTIQVVADPRGSTTIPSSFTLTVTTPGSGNGPGLPNTVSTLLGNRTFSYGIIGAVIVVGLGTTLLLMRKRSRSKSV